MIRTPQPQAQAQTLVAELAALGVTLGRGQSLEIVAKLSGFKGWNEQAAHLKSGSTQKATAPDVRPAKGQLVLPASLLDSLENIVSYADNTGCEDDLTVTSHSAVEQLGQWLTRYKRNLPVNAPQTPDPYTIESYGFTLGEIGATPGYGITAARLASFYQHAKDDAETVLVKATTEGERFTLVLRGQVIVRPKVEMSDSGISGPVSSANGISEDDLMLFEAEGWDQTVHVDRVPVFEWRDARGTPVSSSDVISTDPQVELRMLSHNIVVRNAHAQK